MYNETLKMRFISEYTQKESVAKMYESMFNGIEPWETKWNADFCTMPLDEIQKCVDNLSGVRASSKEAKLVLLKNYVNWCIKIGIEGARNDISQIKNPGILKIRQSMVANPKHLQMYLDAVFDKEEENTPDNVMRAYLWLSYSGMDEEDILKLTRSNVDFSNMVVTYNDKQYELYKESVECLRRCAEEERFVHKNPLAFHTVYKPRAEGNQLIRGIGSSPYEAYVIRMLMSRKITTSFNEGRVDMKLTCFRAWLSGVFYRMREGELASGEPADFRGFVAERYEGKSFKLDSGRNTQASKLRQVAASYLRDYNDWKFIFS